MLLNFKSQFEPMILEGSKDQTIRKERKDGRRPMVGEKLYLYTRLRTKGSRKIGEAICTEVFSIDLYSHTEGQVRFAIQSDHPPTVPLGRRLDIIARRDGFRSWEDLLNFFVTVHTLPFGGFVTRWKDFEPA